MHGLVLAVACLLQVIWPIAFANAKDRSHPRFRPGLALLGSALLVCSLVGFIWSLNGIPLAVAWPVWSLVGVIGVVGVAWAVNARPRALVRPLTLLVAANATALIAVLPRG